MKSKLVADLNSVTLVPYKISRSIGQCMGRKNMIANLKLFYAKMFIIISLPAKI